MRYLPVLPLLPLLAVSAAHAQLVCPEDSCAGGAVDVVATLQCSSAVSGLLDGADPSQLGGDCASGACYPCGSPTGSLEQNGPEHVYAFHAQADGAVTARLTGATCELDLYVLESACDVGSCVAGATETGGTSTATTFTASVGTTYYVVVQGVGGGGGSCAYDLAFDLGGGCVEDCANGLDDDLDGSVDCEDGDCAGFYGCYPAAETIRLGTPPNPNAFQPGATSPPILGATWDPSISHAAFQPGAVLDFAAAAVQATNLPLGATGTLLIDPSTILVTVSASPGAPLSFPLPPNCGLVGLTLPVQGASFDGAVVALTNAIDVTFGLS